MGILGLGWAGLKVRDRAAAARFFAGTLGMEQVRASDLRDDTVFRLPSGQVFEVDDVEAFRRDMSERGVEFVTEVEGGPKYGRWCYFRGPEGCLFQAFSRAKE